MIRMRLSEAARMLEAAQTGADREFLGVSTDTRSLQKNNLFVALQGPRYDGHDFIEQARACGAAGALVQRRIETPLATLIVQHTRPGLGRLAAGWRARFHIPLVAVTGSNGKTTVKEMIAAILNRRGATLVTQGNLNNDIGVPLTLLALSAMHRHAVIEMGANHPGEIACLTQLARPTVALITNAGPAHLEGFGSIEGVAHAKGEIYSGLDEHGVAIINHDDLYSPLWRTLARNYRALTFGLKPGADVTGELIRLDGATRLRLHTPHGNITVHLRLPGRHNVLNALGACAAALAAGAGLEDVRAGLEGMTPVKGRLEGKRGVHGAQIIDDTYNANPASLKAALEFLAGLPAPRWLILGDMGELGAEGAALHAEAGREARARGVERLFATGELSRFAVQSFGHGADHFSDQQHLADVVHMELAALDPTPVTILVKGSRASGMERVVAALTETPMASAGAH
ncbi:MAG: UDP-N-acetylmuramoyl-tripeptide--D-alanyl-D-alanine ligase [Gammaproteobacteria bacterium]